MKIRCFVDENGHVWSVDHNDESNYPGEIKINGSDVLILGPSDGDGQLIEEEYTLWPSLTELAMTIEQDVKPSEDGSVSLDQAVAESHLLIQSFKKDWLENNKVNPTCYPMSFPKNNAGVWFEQIQEHSEEKV